MSIELSTFDVIACWCVEASLVRSTPPIDRVHHSNTVYAFAGAVVPLELGNTRTPLRYLSWTLCPRFATRTSMLTDNHRHDAARQLFKGTSSVFDKREV